jgi:hypothetical protein
MFSELEVTQYIFVPKYIQTERKIRTVEYGFISILILEIHSSDYKNLQLLNGIMWRFINRISLKSAKKHGHYG